MTLLVLGGVVVLTILAVWLFFPRKLFISLARPSGGAITFSRACLSFDTAPDHYPTNGVDHLEPYLSHLLVLTNGFKALQIFTPDGNRGFGFTAKDGVVLACLTLQCRQEGQREVAIREFFKSFGIAPTRDYLANNGAARILEYRLQGSCAELTALTKRILQELCGVSPTDPLDIHYEEN